MKNKLINNIVFLVSIVLFALIINRYGYTAIMDNLSKVGLWFFPILGIWLLVYILNTFAFKNVVKYSAKEIPFSKMFSIIVSSYSLNYITPIVALGGEIFKINALKEYLSTKEATSITVNYYIMHVLSHIAFWILGLILLVFSLEQSVSNIKLIAFMVLFIASILVLFYLLLNKNALFNIYKFAKRLPMPKSVSNILISKEDSIIEINRQIQDFYNKDKSNFFSALSL